jgi:hypothetical protein
MESIPYDCIPVVVELEPGATPIQDFEHPERAFYVLGPEDGSVPRAISERCPLHVYVPTRDCMNLAATANVILFDRMMKRHEFEPPTCGNLPPIPEREIMNIQTLAERFCSTPLPESVCADLCATKQGPGRSGTNLLTIEEAKEVLERILPFNREMGRDDVYTLIDGERDHQDAKWGEIEDHPHEVGSWILILEKLVQDARLAWVGKTGDKGALAEVRQIAAVAVACMEEHGAPRRQ